MLKTGLTEVNGHRCAVLDTDDHYSLDYEALLAAASPRNWPRCLSNFRRMIPNGHDSQRRERYIEHVRYGLLTLRTPLVIWSIVRPDGYRLRYELDTGPMDFRRIDGLVVVDEGYVDVERHEEGVRARTHKVLAITGTSAWLGATAAHWLGWNAYGAKFFHNQAALTDPVPLVPHAGWSPPRQTEGVVRDEY